MGEALLALFGMALTLWVGGWLLDLAVYGLLFLIVGGGAAVASFRGKGGDDAVALNPFTARLASLVSLVAQIVYILLAISAAEIAIDKGCYGWLAWIAFAIAIFPGRVMNALQGLLGVVTGGAAKA